MDVSDERRLDQGHDPDFAPNIEDVADAFLDWFIDFVVMMGTFVAWIYRSVRRG